MSKKSTESQREDASESYKVFDARSNSDENNEQFRDSKNAAVKSYKSIANFKPYDLNLQASDLSVFKKFDPKLDKNKSEQKIQSKDVDQKIKEINQEKVQTVIENMVDENRLKPDLQDDKDDKQIQAIMNEIIGETKLKPEFEPNKKDEHIKPIIEYLIDETKLKPETAAKKEAKKMEDRLIKKKGKKSNKKIDKSPEKKSDKSADKKLHSKKKRKETIEKIEPEIKRDKEKVRTIIEHMIDENKLKPEIEYREVKDIKKIIEHMIEENKLKPEIDQDKSDRPIKTIKDGQTDDKKTTAIKQQNKRSDEKIKKHKVDKTVKEKPGIVIVIDSGKKEEKKTEPKKDEKKTELKKEEKKTDLKKEPSNELNLKELIIPPMPDMQIGSNSSSDNNIKKDQSNSNLKQKERSKKEPNKVDDYSYRKDESPPPNFDLSNKPVEKQKSISINKKLEDPLESIKHKLEEQVYLKQEKPSDFELKSQKGLNSSQKSIKYNKTKKKDDKPEKKIKKSDSLTYYEDVQNGQIGEDHHAISDQKTSPAAATIKDDATKEIHIKSGQNMKANLKLGKEIKAKVEESHPKIETEKLNDNNDDWSSISIQLDITKDPKTKKIEINEDVKVLPIKDDEENRQLLEDAKKERANTFYKPSELIPYVVGQKPSITHYVKKNNEPIEPIDKVTEETKPQKFERYYAPSDPDIKPIDKQSKQVDDSKSEIEPHKSKTEDDQEIVIFKAKPDTEKRFESSKELNSTKVLKRMDQIKKPSTDSSSDEQTYEQIINKRNDLLKLKFPNLSLSPPAFQPTPPPFHLKMKQPSADSIRSSGVAKSEELTYYEQKKKFNLTKTESSDEKSVPESDDKLVEKQLVDYENIKKLDIPSEKVAEIGNKNNIKSTDSKSKEPTRIPIKLNGAQKKHEVKIDKKDIDKPITITTNHKPDTKLGSESKHQSISSIQDARADLNDTEDDEISIISKFNNEIERLRTFERYLNQVKSILNNENPDLNIKKSLIRRLILIKRDLNRLSQLCDNLLDENNLNRSQPSKAKKIGDDGRTKVDQDDSDDDSSDDKNEKVKKSNLKILKDKLNEKRSRKKKFANKNQSSEVDAFEEDKEPKISSNLKDFKHPDVDDKKNEKMKDQNAEQRQKDDQKPKDDQKSKDDQKKDKNLINDKKLKFNKMKDKMNKFLKSLLRSNLFRLFLCFIIFCTFMYTYCHLNQSKLHKRFPCRLKKKFR